MDDDKAICSNNAGGGETGGRDGDRVGNGAYPHIVDRTKRARRMETDQTVSWGGVLRDKPPRRCGFLGRCTVKLDDAMLCYILCVISADLPAALPSGS